MKSFSLKFNISFFRNTGIVFLIVLLGFACNPDKDVPITTFKGDLVYSFLKKDSAYSEYVKLIDRAGLMGMLNAYGSYTCLAPTNLALKSYFKALGSDFTIDSLRQGQIDSLVRTHIIPGKFMTYDLKTGVMPGTNMNKRFIEVLFDTITGKIRLNEFSTIVSKDNVVYNGVVHGINSVLRLSNIQLPALINNNPALSIFSEALILTHLSDSISLIEDLNYVPIVKEYFDQYNVGKIPNATERKYGYTAFIEDNALLKTYGINNLADLIKKANELYPSGKGYENEYTNRNNSLNQYISYHLLEKAVYLNKFFYRRRMIKGYTPDEFLETMLPNRIMKVSLVDAKRTLNANSDNPVHVLEVGGKITVNGVYHLVDKMLYYTSGVDRMLLNTRIRVDMTSLFPELTNNNMRGLEGAIGLERGYQWGYQPGYFKYIKMSKDTRLMYNAGTIDENYGGYGTPDYQGDNMLAVGSYDVTVRLLPVPPGTYQLRIGYNANANRSITQIYLDNKPIGIPLDMKIIGTDPRIGWIPDSQTDDNGVENDKMMRNRGYMKAAGVSSDGKDLIRNMSGPLRRIVGTFDFNDYQPHYLRFKSVISDNSKQVLLDYFEWTPKNIYNPDSGEPESRE